MKFLHQLSTLILATFALALFTFSCEATDQKDEASPSISVETQSLEEDADGVGNIVDDALAGYEAAIIDHVDNHSLDLDQLEEITLEHPDGTSEDVLLLEEDIAISKKQLRDFETALEEGIDKQYRTFNLVSPQVITVIGYTGSGYNLTNKMRTALSWAVANYNALNLNITFSLSYSASTNADIVVYRNISNNGAGGVAGFPSGGQPYKWVQIYNGMEGYDTNTNEHVITHEIGHCVGFRHTDWQTRASCGQSGEGAGSDGAVLIPGTPSGIDWASIMLACFSSNEDGEFGYYDRVALQYLY